VCFPFDARPPEAPDGDRQAVTARDVVLTSADGTRFAAFSARAEQPSGAGVVVLPDVRGLYSFYEELARGFAAQGIDAVAIDYFGRTAGAGKRGEDFPWTEHVAQAKQARVSEDIGAAVAFLRSPDGGSCTSVFTVGFCFGGGASWMQAAAGHGLAGVIGFYGRPGPAMDGTPGPSTRAKEFTVPVLALVAGADDYITPEQNEQMRNALEEAGVEHEFVVYEGAPHSFFDRSFKEHAEASADAWRRVLAFIRAHRRQPAESR
jgi:carboxymethylenebutenolidase